MQTDRDFRSTTMDSMHRSYYILTGILHTHIYDPRWLNLNVRWADVSIAHQLNGLTTDHRALRLQLWIQASILMGINVALRLNCSGLYSSYTNPLVRDDYPEDSAGQERLRNLFWASYMLDRQSVSHRFRFIGV